jgi:hypothetical protein
VVDRLGIRLIPVGYEVRGSGDAREVST